MNKTYEYNIDYKCIKITNTEISEIIGYSASEVPDMVSMQINEILNQIGDHCYIIAGYRIFENTQVRNNSLLIEGKIFQTKKIIAAALKQTNSLAVFVCTAGEKLSHWINQLLKDDSVKGYIADTIASLTVEKATDQLQDRLEKLVLENCKNITNRYSPGYCGWDVSEQHKLFSLLPEKFCGVSLNEAALMNPLKSVSGIIGIGENVKKTNYQCNKCEMKDCLLSKQ
ncbi:vitamin B12 dependent-methionine synthase activation domain-containing protein [Bacteroidota bacterium]